VFGSGTPSREKEIMRRSRIAAIAAVGCSFALLTPTLASAHPGNAGSGDRESGQSRLSWAMSRGPLTDLLPTEPGPFDQARGMALMVGFRSSTFVLHVSGVDPTVAAGRDFGAHLHMGTCVAGDGAAAGPHYNIDVVKGVALPVVSDKTEVWLDFVVNASGRGEATVRVPWVPTPGDHAIVIHQEPTKANGSAGARQACIPFVVH
jgi:superoxide dismutase, Cu-Zn family